MKRATSKKLASALFALTGCVLCVWTFARAQTPKPTPGVKYQHVIACAPEELAAEVRKANESGVTVYAQSECVAVDVKIVCVSGVGEDEGDGR